MERAGFIKAMEAICGAEGVVSEREQLRTYECDGLMDYRVVPDLVVLPESAEQVQLREIPGMEIKEVKEAEICCGSAGIYNMVEPAAELGERKAKNVLQTGAPLIVTSNPGCMLQIQASLKKMGHDDVPMAHPMEVIDASIRGESVESLLR